MRRAELVMACVMAAFSLYLMWKSTELPIGWLPGEGPGGGAFPFWLSLGMLVCCLWVIVRWFTTKPLPCPSSEEKQYDPPPYLSSKTYMDRRAVKSFLLVAGSLTAMIAIVHIIGVYGAVPLFLIFYMRFLGRHGWTTTCALAAGMPVAAFFFFEIALKITLPKGFTEPLFYPLYDIFL